MSVSGEKIERTLMAAESGVDPGPSRRVRLTAFLLACLAALLVLKALDGFLELGLFKTPLDLRLRAAASAVVAEEAGKNVTTTPVTPPEGTPVEVSTGQALSRVAAVKLLMELESAREQCQGIANGIVASKDLARPGDARPAELSQATRLWQEAQNQTGDLLTLEPPHAALVLACLKWPWLGDDPADLTVDDLDRPIDVRPAPFRDMKRRTWADVLSRAEEERPWHAIEEELVETYKLTNKQLRALQAYVCCRDARRAFDSPDDLRVARVTLERMIVLTPVQVETVLAMRGMQELISSGTPALPPAIDLLERQPLVATTVLRGCLQRLGVEEKALSAAANLSGASPELAENMLRALGPFGIEAIQIQSQRTGRPLDPAAESILRELQTTWPGKNTGMDSLGIDRKLWWRWYRQAKPVLQPA